MNRRTLLAAGAAMAVAPKPVPNRSAELSMTMTSPIIVAHRTSMLSAPENTVKGIATAATQGVPMAEMDVQWSQQYSTGSQGAFPVLMHDTTVDRTTNGTGTVISHTQAQLTSMTVDIDPNDLTQKVPYGYDFMKACSDNDIDALLDIHAVPTELMITKLMYYIDMFNYASRTWIMADDSVIDLFQAQFPGRNYLMIEAYSNPGTGVIRSGKYLQDIGVKGYVTTYDRCTPESVAYWQSFGLEVWGWSSDTPAVDIQANWEAMRTAGVNRILTNRPVDALAWSTA